MERIRENVQRGQTSQFLAAAAGLHGEEKESPFGTSYLEQVRERVYILTSDADSSWHAWVFANFVIGCICVSVVAFCVETIPSLEVAYEAYWFDLEVFMIGVFTVELSARIWSSPMTWGGFLFDPLNVVDLLTVVPFYVYLVMSAVSPVDFFMLRVFRLFRLVSMMKMARYSKMMILIIKALQAAAKVTAILLMMLLVATILFASLMCMAEKGVYDSEQGCYIRPLRPDLGCSPFDSVPASLYWGITTLTGVGYGDHYPVTPWGKAIACAAMVVGVLALALPVVLIGVHMSNTMVFLKSEIDSKAHRKVENAELFQAVIDFDALCLRIAVLGEDCQRLVLGSNACKLRMHAFDEDEHMQEIVTRSKPCEILCNRMLQRFLDLKKYVNSVDINDVVNHTNDF